MSPFVAFIVGFGFGAIACFMILIGALGNYMDRLAEDSKKPYVIILQQSCKEGDHGKHADKEVQSKK